MTFVFVTHAQSEALALSDRIVVMNAGRIEQISAPYELYTRPRSQFVAKFIGRNALINGKVISADTNGCRLDTAFGELAGTSRVAMPRRKHGKPCGARRSDRHSACLDAARAISPRSTVATRSREPSSRFSRSDTSFNSSSSSAPPQPIIVEGHADKYAGRFQGEEVLLAWKKDVATLVVD